MTLAVNSNLNSLGAQRQLALNASQLSTSLQRLSSGLRINSAKDDAAGLAISERLSTQVRGTDQAARNANDGISLAQTTDGALSSIGNNLQRIRELAVQSANGTNSATDRAALQAEAAQLVAENDRIVAQTQFNGNALLDGSFMGQQFQVGADRAQTLAMTALPSVKSSALGKYNGFSQQDQGIITNGAASALSVTLGGVGTVINLGTVATDAKALATAINAAGIPGLSATSPEFHVVFSGGSQTSFGAVDGTAVLTINGTAINLDYRAGVQFQAKNRQTAIDAINAQSAKTGAAVRDDPNGWLSYYSLDGRNVVASYSAGTATSSVATDFALHNLSGIMSTGSLMLDYQAPQASGVTSLTLSGAGLSAPPVNTVLPTGTALSALDISTVTGANAALDSLDAALNSVNAARASVGAFQNRLQATVANLQSSGANLQAARSRIQDADFAQETASLSRSQILQQASTAMLAQANQAPSGVLALLKA